MVTFRRLENPKSLQRSELGGDQRTQLAAVRMAPGREFRVDQLAVYLDFKRAAPGGDQLPRCDSGLEFLDQVSRDTHGTRGIVSRSAVCDRDLCHGGNPPFDCG